MNWDLIDLARKRCRNHTKFRYQSKTKIDTRKEIILHRLVDYSNPCSLQMTKWKAAESLDKWLIEWRVVLEVQSPATEIPSEPCITTPPPAAEGNQLQVASGLVTENSTEWI